MAMATRLELDKDALFRQLGYEPHEGQLAVHRSKAKRRILICGTRFGKSLCAAMECLATAMEPRKRTMIWIVAPTMELSDKAYREVVIVVAEHLKHRLIELKQHDKRILIRNLGGGVSEIRGKTADNPVSLLGEGLDLVVVDEASRLKPAIWHSFLAQRLVDKDGSALLISTPKGRGYLFDMWKKGQPGGDPDFESWNLPSWVNPHLDRALIEKERERLPDAVFRQEFGAEWIEGVGSVFRGVREAATGDFEEPVAGKSYVAGLDLAKVNDFTALTILDRNRRVVHFQRFHRIAWDLQVARVKAATERYNHAEVNMDATGVGDPLFDLLRKAGIRTRGYKFSHQSKDALITSLSVMLEKGEITLPKPDLCPELIDELESFTYHVTESGNVTTSAPGGQNDDCVVSLALAAWLVRRQPAPMRVTWL